MTANPVPSVVLDPVRESLISSSGALLLKESIRAAGLGRGLSGALARWRPARAQHDPGKVLLDLATAVALGGDCLADIAAVRAQPTIFGSVASDPTVSRLFAAMADDVDAAVAAIREARARARTRVWAKRRPLAGTPGSRTGGQVIIDIDATLVTAHSDKEGAEPTFKRGFGFAPMCSFVDHGQHGTGETLGIDLRPGKASPWNSADHVATLDAALLQLPEHERAQVLVRADTGACSKLFLHHITDAGLQQHAVTGDLPAQRGLQHHHRVPARFAPWRDRLEQAREAGQIGAGVTVPGDQGVPDRHRVDRFAGGEALADRDVDRLVPRVVEVPRPKPARHPVGGGRGEHQGAEGGLFG